MLTAGSFTCDVTVNGTLDLSRNGVWWVGGTSPRRQMAPMTLCAGEIRLSRSSISGTVTLVADEIQISDSSLNLTANEHGVLAFATGDDSQRQ